MLKTVMIVDDRMDEICQIISQWRKMPDRDPKQFVELRGFVSVDQTCKEVRELQPYAIVIGHGLGVLGVTGADVIRAVRAQGYQGVIIGNSGGGAQAFTMSGVTCDAYANRDARLLCQALNMKKEEKMERGYENFHKTINEFQGLVADGKFEKAKKYLEHPGNNWHWLDNFIQRMFMFDTTPLELIERALELFLVSRDNSTPRHGDWVHSLSHFTQAMWSRRMTGWIKRFNEVAFRGANELGDTNCCERLVRDFDQYAQPSDAKADFGLTKESLRWMHEDEDTLMEKKRRSYKSMD